MRLLQIEKFVLFLIFVACFILGACGVSYQRDLSLEGARDLFKKRLMNNNITEAEKTAQSELALQAQADNMRKRRRVLQIRVPANHEFYDPDVMGSFNPTLTGVSGPERAYISAKQNLETTKRALKINLAELEKSNRTYKELINFEAENYRFQIETMLLKKLAELRTQRDALAAKTRIGGVRTNGVGSGADSTEDGAEGANGAGVVRFAPFFGRNRLGPEDEFVDLKQSFIFIGDDIATGVSLGRSQGLDGKIQSRKMSVNFNGTSVPVTLKSLAQSIGLPIFLSPAVLALEEEVHLNVNNVETLNVLDILIDTHDVIMAYDRDMEIARFYTGAEFATRLENARQAVEQHNSLAEDLRQLRLIETAMELLQEVYRKYFKDTDRKARLDTLSHDLILTNEYPLIVKRVIADLKQLAFTFEQQVWTRENTRLPGRRELEDEIFNLRKEIELLEVNVRRTKDMYEKSMAASAASSGQPTQGKNKFSFGGAFASSSAPSAAEAMIAYERNRASVIRDVSLATTQPIFTESFTIYYQKTDDVKDALNTYFAQIYPDDLKIVTVAESLVRQLQEDMEGASTQVQRAEKPANSGAAADGAAEGEEGEEAGADSEQAAANAPTAPNEPPAPTEPSAENRLFIDSDFQPPKIESNKTSIVMTGLKTDIDLAHQLINDIDIPAKQVLVEVFMVNVTRNWQRQLEISLQDIAGELIADDLLLDFASNIAGAGTNLNNTVTVSKNAPSVGAVEALINFMEMNNIGRTISSPTILAKDEVSASISRTTTRFRTETVVTRDIVDGVPTTQTSEETVEVPATLTLEVTPTINVLNDHVTLAINFTDESFLGENANDPQLSNVITTTLDAAPGDVIVLAGLYKETNKKNRSALPGFSSVPVIGTLLGGSQDDQIFSDELVIFIAPTVITPQSGVVPANAVR